VKVLPVDEKNRVVIARFEDLKVSISASEPTCFA
jgi:hypothetical protein